MGFGDLRKIDHINQIITLTMTTTLSGLHCSIIINSAFYLSGDNSNFGNCGFGIGVQEFCSVADDASVFLKKSSQQH
jgi:hypothetical protein